MGGRRELWSSQGGLHGGVGLRPLGQAVVVLWEEGCESHGATLTPQLSHRLPWLLRTPFLGTPLLARPEPRGPLSSSPGSHAALPFLLEAPLAVPCPVSRLLAGTHPHTGGTYFLTLRLPAQ